MLYGLTLGPQVSRLSGIVGLEPVTGVCFPGLDCKLQLQVSPGGR